MPDDAFDSIRPDRRTPGGNRRSERPGLTALVAAGEGSAVRVVTAAVETEPGTDQLAATVRAEVRRAVRVIALEVHEESNPTKTASSIRAAPGGAVRVAASYNEDEPVRAVLMREIVALPEDLRAIGLG